MHQHCVCHTVSAHLQGSYRCTEDDDTSMSYALTGAFRLALTCFQVSTYKIVTVNASRNMSDQPGGIGSGQRLPNSGGRLMSHPENSATIEQEILDEELHSPDANAKDEMQTWMLLEVCSTLACSSVFFQAAVCRWTTSCENVWFGCACWTGADVSQSNAALQTSALACSLLWILVAWRTLNGHMKHSSHHAADLLEALLCETVSPCIELQDQAESCRFRESSIPS